jgi:hypothetical protein
MIIIYGVIILAFFIVLVEVLSVAMKITGLDIEIARFQLISIITHTGFTTKESELITQHPVRRRIAKIVMLISYVVTVSLIGIIITFLTRPSFLYALVAVIILLFGVIFIINNKHIIGSFDKIVERQILKQIVKDSHKRTVEEVLKLNDEYGVAEFVVGKDCPINGVTLLQSGLKQKYIQVLNIDRGSGMIHFPKSDFVFDLGDKVVVYGRLDNIKKLVSKKQNINSEKV